MKQIKSNYAIVNNDDDKIYLYDDEVFNFRPLYAEVFENVTITLEDNGNTMIMEGDKRQYDITFHDVYPSELNEKVHPDYIEKTRFTKKDIVRSGWYRLTENKHKTIISNHYTIIKDGEMHKELYGD